MRRHSYILGFLSALLVVQFAWAEDEKPIKGFPKEVIEKVLKGKIVEELKTDKGLEYHTINRAYFKKIDMETYVRLAVDHEKYVDMFDEVTRAETTDSSKTKYEYSMDYHLEMGIISKKIKDVLGQHTIDLKPNKDGERIIVHEITSHKNNIEFLVQKTRLIPYKGGLLVEEDVHVKTQESFNAAALLKRFLKQFFNKYINTFREELGANPALEEDEGAGEDDTEVKDDEETSASNLMPIGLQ